MSRRWDDYFRRMCDTVASQSRCLSRKVGSVIVRDKFVVSTGFNGPPIGVPECWERQEIISEVDSYCFKNQRMYPHMVRLEMCPRKYMGYRSGEGIQWCAAAHGERNSVDIAARMGHSTDGCTMYLNCGIPCMECAKTIIQAGIKEIVVVDATTYEKDGITGKMMLNYGGVRIRTYDDHPIFRCFESVVG